MAKTPDQLNLKPVRSHPADIIKGFTDLGYDAPEIDRQFDFHKADLQDDDDSREYSDDDVYQYMRDHLADKGILPNVDETLDHYRARLGREPSNEEYRNWIKPKIAQRVKEYRGQKTDEKLALDELMDEFGYEDLVNEAWNGSKIKKIANEEIATKPTPVEKSQFKKGQHNLKDEWNKQLDALEKSKPDKKGIIDKMRNYDDEAIELTRAFLSMMGGKW